MSLGGISDYLRANNISIPENSGTYLPYANQGPYEDIMARMRASGGRGGSGGATGGGGTGAPVVGATGGYDPNLYRRAAAAPVAGTGMMDEILSRGGRGSSLEADDIKKSQDAWTNLSDAQKANYYANNPTMAGITQTLGKLFGLSSIGMLQKYLYPEFVQNQELIARGITPNATSEINTGNTVQDPMQRQQLAQQLGLLQTPVSDAAIPRYELNVGSGFTPVVAAPEAAVATPVTYSPITTTDLPSFNDYSFSEINTGNTVQDPMQRQELARQLGLLETPVSETPMTGGFTPALPPVAVTSPVTYSPIVSNDLPSSDDYSNEGRNYVAPAPVVAPAPAPPPAPTYYSGGFEDDGGREGQQRRNAAFNAALAAAGSGDGSYTGGYQTSGEFKGMPSIYGGIGASAYAKGGPVSMNRLQGPNPAGPDDGYATLKSGEFVINNKAVKKYGIELMNAINSGKISKGKLRGLLEM